MKLMRTLSVLTMIPQIFRGTKLNAEGKEVPIKARFIPGDKFYNYMRHKRVNGKWRVKR